jgi:hypothetical protein
MANSAFPLPTVAAASWSVRAAASRERRAEFHRDSGRREAAVRVERQGGTWFTISFPVQPTD